MQSLMTLSRENNILGVSGDWDRFAEGNGGSPSIMSDAIVGGHLFDFVHGHEAQFYLNALIFSCRRSGMPFRDEFRCDSPTRRRLWSMTLIPVADDSVVFHYQQLQDSAVPWSTIGVERAGTGCFLCGVSNRDGKWVDLMAEGRLVQAEAPILCPTCRSRTRQLLAD